MKHTHTHRVYVGFYICCFVWRQGKPSNKTTEQNWKKKTVLRVCEIEGERERKKVKKKHKII